MQFREVGKRIQVIRASYDPAAKRAVAKMLFSVESWSDGKLTDDQRCLLTDDEVKELTDYFADRRARASQSQAAASRAYAPESIARMAAQIAAVEASELASLGDAWGARMWASVDALSKALRKAKVPKPRRK